MADDNLTKEEKLPEPADFELPPAPDAEAADFELPPAPDAEAADFELPPAPEAEAADLEIPPAPDAEAADFEIPPAPAVEAAAPPTRSTGETTSDDKLWALLAYVFSPLVPIIIMFMEDKKNRPYLKLHNMQALVAGVAILAISLILGAIPVINCVSPVLAFALWLLMVYYGLQAYNGKPVTIPVITEFVKKQGWA